MIKDTVEIKRRADEVFAYLDALERHGEWQTQILAVELLSDGPVGVGTRARETRKVGVGQRQFTYEITEHEPPRRSAFRGIDGPIRPVGTVIVEPVGEGSSSRVTIDFDFEGHGLGKLLAPLARRQARKLIPEDHQRLKQRLEEGASG